MTCVSHYVTSSVQNAVEKDEDTILVARSLESPTALGVMLGLSNMCLDLGKLDLHYYRMNALHNDLLYCGWNNSRCRKAGCM